MSGQGQIRVERSQKRVRVMLGGEVVGDTRHPLMVWERPYYPTYYFPEADVRTDLLIPADRSRRSPLGDAPAFTVKAGATEAVAGAYHYAGMEELRNHIAFVWNTMDHWFEEDEEVYVHPRDPHTRVDVLRSSRHVRIEVGGVTLAESVRPTLLFETGLPVRYYLPKTDVRMHLMERSERSTGCPYKGTAEYWSVVIDGDRLDDVVWSYPFPTLEAARIAGLVCFYDERVDVYIDEEKQVRPETIFSRSSGAS
jgi:uncharacterized protein (DUF427 family)